MFAFKQLQARVLNSLSSLGQGFIVGKNSEEICFLFKLEKIKDGGCHFSVDWNIVQGRRICACVSSGKQSGGVKRSKACKRDTSFQKQQLGPRLYGRQSHGLSGHCNLTLKLSCRVLI